MTSGTLLCHSCFVGVRDGLSWVRRNPWPTLGYFAIALVGANLALALRSGLPLWNEDEGLFPQSTALLAGFAALAVFVTAKRPKLLVGKLLVVVCLGELLRQVTFSYAFVGLVVHPGSSPGAPFASWLSQALFAFPGEVALLIWLPLLFPDGDAPVKWLRPVAWIGFVPLLSTLFIGVLIFDRRGTAFLMGPDPEHPFPHIVSTIDHWSIGAVLNVVPWIALASLLYRYWRGDEATRRQLRWFLIAAVTIVITLLGDHFAFARPRWLRLINSLPWVPAAVALAVVRERLFDIEVVVRRSIVFGGLTAVIVGFYVAVVGAASTLFNATGLVPSIVGTGAAAVAFQPARSRLEQLAERVVFGGARDGRAAVARMTAAFAPDTRNALPDLCETVIEATRVSGAGIDARYGASGYAGLTDGTRVDIALVHQGVSVGTLALVLGPGERRLSKTETAVVDQLTPLLASTVHALGLADELRLARERLVMTREEERRRLRRDLHDGLGPALAAVTMEIQAARAMLAADRDGAEIVLKSAEDWARDAIGEIRRVVQGLRPPVLDQLGLTRAIEEHARAVERDAPGRTFRVTVEGQGPIDRASAATEVAAYLIVLEALTNVVRHAGAKRCTITLTMSAELRVEVADDGIGLVSTGTGVGLSSMRERAQELGGMFSVTSAENGTTVVAVLPVGAER